MFTCAAVAAAGWPEPVCDAHSHVYPENPAREATLAEYLAAARSIGVGRHVIVQSKAYRHDWGGTLDVVARLGLDRARAILWNDPSWRRDDRERLHAAGVRGVRFLFPPGSAVDVAALAACAALIAPLGWHLLVQAEGEALSATVLEELAELDCPVVIDHIGRFAPAVAAGSPSFQALVRFVGDGGWVKLAAPYYGTPDHAADFRPLQARIQALLDAGHSRIIWGMNWPHVNLPADRRPVEWAMLDSLLAVLRSESAARLVLAENASRLYGFAAAPAALL
jgi:D-galactarolactone isomerase